MLISDRMKSTVVQAEALYKKDPAKAKKLLVEAAAEKGGLAAMLTLVKCAEEAGNKKGSAEAILLTLCNPESDAAFGADVRSGWAMDAVAILKDDPTAIQDLLPIINTLAPKYSILTVCVQLAEAFSMNSRFSKSASAPKTSAGAKAGSSAPPAAKPTSATNAATSATTPATPATRPVQPDKPWKGPIIEDVTDEVQKHATVEEASPSTPASRASVPARIEAPASSAASTAPSPVRTASPSGATSARVAASSWRLEAPASGEHPQWVLDLEVASIDSLSEVHLDMSDAVVRLTPVAGGAVVAEADVPAGADSEAASARWSKRRKTLTIRMPQRLR